MPCNTDQSPVKLVVQQWPDWSRRYCSDENQVSNDALTKAGGTAAAKQDQHGLLKEGNEQSQEMVTLGDDDEE
jgi:hypothetical protein